MSKLLLSCLACASCRGCGWRGPFGRLSSSCASALALQPAGPRQTPPRFAFPFATIGASAGCSCLPRSGLHRPLFAYFLPSFTAPPNNHWSGPPPARHLGRKALRFILRLAAQAPSRLRPLSSNVRQHTEIMMVLAIAAGAAVAAKDQMPLQPRLAVQSKQTERPRSSSTFGAPAKRSPRRVLVGHESSPLERLLRSVSPWGRLAAAVRACAQRSWVETTTEPLAQVRTAGASAASSARQCLGVAVSRIGLARSAVLPNWSLEWTATGMAPWPRDRAVYHRPRGQGATPASAPQLKR